MREAAPMVSEVTWATAVPAARAPTRAMNWTFTAIAVKVLNGACDERASKREKKYVRENDDPYIPTTKQGTLPTHVRT